MKDRITLTDRQQEILEIIIFFQVEHGASPTVRELMDLTVITSPQGVVGHLNALAKKGYIECTARKSRGIRLIRSRECPIVCHRCPRQCTCEHAFDPRNVGVEPMEDCLGAE